MEKLPSTRYSQPLPLSSFLSFFCPSFFSQPIPPFQSSFYPVRFSYFLCPSSNHASSLHLPRRSAFFRTIFPRFLLLSFRELCLATRSESFEIIAVTNDTVVNWNRLRNSASHCGEAEGTSERKRERKRGESGKETTATATTSTGPAVERETPFTLLFTVAFQIPWNPAHS